MNPPKCSDEDYINFVIATPRTVTATEAARVQPEGAKMPQHDAFTRLLERLEPDPETLWHEAECGWRGPIGASSTVLRLRHLATVLALI
jgi:hypothetical protein